MNLWNRRFLKWEVAASLAVLALAVYQPFLSSPAFVWDDLPIIVENALMRSWRSLPRLLSNGYWEGAIGFGASVQEFRPVVLLSYFLTERVCGLSPLAFRLGNIMLHAANAALLWAF